MFPRGHCEAGDIIEEHWALLNSEAYYQSLSSISSIHTCISLSLFTDYVPLSLNLAAHSTVAQGAPSLLLSRGNKYTLLLFFCSHVTLSGVLPHRQTSYDWLGHTLYMLQRRLICSAVFLVNLFSSGGRDNANLSTSELDRKQILCQLC